MSNANEAQPILIRLVAHAVNNPHMIDKLIVVKGLPYEWVFKRAKYHIERDDGTFDDGVGDQLLAPWEPDADVNIPHEVRDSTEKITYLKWFPDVRHQDKTYRGFWDKRSVWGLKLDHQFGPAQDLWNKIEDFIDQSLGRGEKMPVPVQVAKDQHTEFKTFMARRGKSLSSFEMVEMPVPVVDLRKPSLITPDMTGSPNTVTQILQTIVTVPTNPSPPVLEPKEDKNMYRCSDCNKEFEKMQALRMHKVGAHRKEKVKA